jgi:hypothetical protein
MEHRASPRSWPPFSRGRRRLPPNSGKVPLACSLGPPARRGHSTLFIVAIFVFHIVIAKTKVIQNDSQVITTFPDKNHHVLLRCPGVCFSQANSEQSPSIASHLDRIKCSKACTGEAIYIVVARHGPRHHEKDAKKSLSNRRFLARNSNSNNPAVAMQDRPHLGSGAASSRLFRMGASS